MSLAAAHHIWFPLDRHAHTSFFRLYFLLLPIEGDEILVKLPMSLFHLCACFLFLGLFIFDFFALVGWKEGNPGSASACEDCSSDVPIPSSSSRTLRRGDGTRQDWRKSRLGGKGE